MESRVQQTVLPIPIEILEKNAALFPMMARLSYVDPDSAIKYLRLYGEKKMPITPMFDELQKLLNEKDAI